LIFNRINMMALGLTPMKWSVAIFCVATCLLPNVRGQEREAAGGVASARQANTATPESDKSADSGASTPTKTMDAAGPAAHDAGSTSQAGIVLHDPCKYKWQVGAKIVTGSNACRDLLITLPVPTAWPEQTVNIVEENFPSLVRDVTYRDLESGVRQMVIKIKTVPPKTIVELDVKFTIEVSEISAPTNTTGLKIPEKLEKEIKPYLGVSPGISYRNARLRKQVKEIVTDKATAWQQVEAIYDWVRENIEFREGEPEDCLKAFRAKSGCAEDLVGLFVAMCRAHDVPARMVWVEGHQLAEFYLVDQDDQGHWFPCNVAGLRDFGSNSDPRIILQKGDNIKVPEKEQRQKYVAEFVTGSGKSQPAVGFVRNLLPN
jgi:hypothetical protein